MQSKSLQKRLLTLPPLTYLLIFFAVPALIMLFASFRYAGEYGGLAPWYYYEEGKFTLDLTLENWQRLFETDIYLILFLKSIGYALLTTLLCILMGYPLALMIARSPKKRRDFLLLMVILPFWSNFLVRIYAWMIIFSPTGILTGMLNGVLGFFGMEPVTLMYSPLAVIVALVYVHLPFMVLPLYANLVKMDFRLLEAAYDLGASPFKAFWLVTVPLSKAGIIAGFMLVFIPSVGEFVIPSLLGGPENIMIGRVVWDEMFSSNNWPRATALAVVMIGLIVVPLAIYYHYTGDAAEPKS